MPKKQRRNTQFRRNKGIKRTIHNAVTGHRTRPSPNPKDIVIAPWNQAILEDSLKGDKDYSFENIAALLCKQLGLQTGTTTKVDVPIDLRVISFQLWGLAEEKSIQVAAASAITGEYTYLRDFPGRNQFSSIGYVFPKSFSINPQQSSTPTWKTNVINIDAGDGQNWLIRIKVLWRANNTAQITRFREKQNTASTLENCRIGFEMI